MLLVTYIDHGNKLKLLAMTSKVSKYLLGQRQIFISLRQPSFGLILEASMAYWSCKSTILAALMAYWLFNWPIFVFVGTSAGV